MVEAIVAAMLLVMVALGVLKGLDTAQQSSGREKARSTAAALTEQDQERLRSFRAVDLANYDETRTINVNNVDYTVQSQVDWVRDSTGGTQSCNNSATQADYMRITSTTTSNLVNTPIAPITQSSLVAPPVGAFGANQGTLGVQVNGRDGTGMEDVRSRSPGRPPSRNPTNSAGCAIFAYVPVGAYTATLNTNGWVDKGGNQSHQRRRHGQQRHRQRQEPRLRPGRQRRRHLRHRDPRRRHGARHDHAAVGRQRRGAHRALRPVRRRARVGSDGRRARHDLGDRPLSRSPTATTSTAAAARAPTRRRTTPTTSRPSARTRSSPSIPPPRRRRPRSGSRRSTCASSTTAPPLASTYQAYTRILVTSTSTNCTREVLLRRAVHGRQRLDAPAGAPVRHLQGVRRVAHAGARRPRCARRRSPASTTSTTTA